MLVVQHRFFQNVRWRSFSDSCNEKMLFTLQ